MLYLTNSEMKDFRRCHRKWWLGYYRGLQRRGTDFNKPLSIGSRVHEVLAAYYVPGLDRVDPMAALRASVERDLEKNPAQEESIRKEADLCDAMITGYLEWLGESGEDADLRVIAPEAEMSAPLIEGVSILSKIDTRVESVSDGSKWALEHKTVQNLSDPVPLLQTDTQLLTEHLVEFLQGDDPDAPRAQGALYNMLRKVKRTAQANPPFYGREEVRHNVYELRSHWRHVARIAGEILVLRAELDAGGDPHDVCHPNPTRDCRWDCEFRDVCLAGLFDDGSDAESAIADLYETGDPLERYRHAMGLTPRTTGDGS